MSVTSSGRSSTRTTIRWHSGLLVVIALAIACITIVLPALGGLTISARWPLPIGITRSMTRVVSTSEDGLQAQPLLRVQRRQLGELGPLAGLLDVLPVDGVEPDERVVLVLALALARLADGAGDGVTAAQAVLADLRQRHVDVVRAGQVTGRPDEAVVVEDVEDAADRDQDVVVADHRLRLVAEALAACAAVAVAAATALAEPAAPAAELVVVALDLRALVLLRLALARLLLAVLALPRLAALAVGCVVALRSGTSRARRRSPRGRRRQRPVRPPSPGDGPRARGSARGRGRPGSGRSPSSEAAASLAVLAVLAGLGGLGARLGGLRRPRSRTRPLDVVPAWRSWMASISWLLRILAVPVMPRSVASDWSWGRTRALRPPAS